MRLRKNQGWAALAPVVGMVATWGCSAIVDSSAYHVVADTAGDGGQDGAAPNADACPSMPAHRQELENQCTTGDCVPFTKTVPSCDGGLCPAVPPPPADAGSAAPLDAGAGDAGSALPSCSTAGPNVVVMTGSTALQTFALEVAKSLAAASTPTTLVYQGSGSCTGVGAVVDPLSNPLSNRNGKVYFYDAAGSQHVNECDLAGLTADIGVSDVFATSCAAFMGTQLPNTVADNFGPVQVMSFIVPLQAHEDSISLEAAYYVFGSGGSDPSVSVPPWTSPSQYFVRSAASGTQSMISAALFGLDPSKWWGNNAGSTGGVLAGITAANVSSDPTIVEATIGIAASDAVDPNRLSTPPTLKILAVKDRNATCSYYPDSTKASFDKRNVRQGLYPIWGPSHLFTKQGAPPAVAELINVFGGVVSLPGVPLVQNYAANHVVPLCAMHVTRSDDGHDYTPYKPAKACDCYYDANVPGGSTSCKTCALDTDCAAGTQCNKWDGQATGYCEAQ